MTGMKSRMAPFFPAIWDDRNEGNVLGMTETVIPTPFLSFQRNVISRHSSARMTME
jgi:hypothetical protein